VQLELRGITKRFPGVIANDDVNLTVERGEIVALLGENGAGKTTLMNMVCGLYTPDEGEILVDGTTLPFSSPADAIDAGIGMVHQHFMLVPVFTVAENVILGNEPSGPTGWLDRKKAERAVTEISDQFNLRVDPEAMVEDLPVGVQQRVEIIKVLHRQAEYLVFDEPTAVLTPPEVEEFFQILNGLRDENKGIVFISHKLGEALELADRIVVMRNGKTVAEVLPSDVDETQLAELMVGRPVSLTVDKTEAEPSDVVLEVQGLAVRDDREQMTVKDISFQVRSGEIVGIAGVQGNGQSELVESLTGLRPAATGSIRIGDRDTTDASPRHVHDEGVAHVPEDRQHMGLIMEFPVYENMVLDSYHQEPYSGRVQMRWHEARRASEELVEQYDVRTPSVDAPVATLSGGNQQKVIVAREFARDTRLVIASQPTRGIDVGSIEYIHSRIVEERDAGSAVLIVSSELEEVMALADRIIVMHAGRIAGEFDAATATTTELGLAMLGSGVAS